jgi:hypothetical protein
MHDLLVQTELDTERISLLERIKQLESQLAAATQTANTNTGTTPAIVFERNSRRSLDPNVEHSAVYNETTVQSCRILGACVCVQLLQQSPPATVSTPTDVHTRRQRQSFAPEFSPLGRPNKQEHMQMSAIAGSPDMTLIAASRTTSSTVGCVRPSLVINADTVTKETNTSTKFNTSADMDTLRAQIVELNVGCGRL